MKKITFYAFGRRIQRQTSFSPPVVEYIIKKICSTAYLESYEVYRVKPGKKHKIHTLKKLENDLSFLEESEVLQVKEMQNYNL